LSPSQKTKPHEMRGFAIYCSYLGNWLPGPDSNQRPID
jgi:hypothetical protein